MYKTVASILKTRFTVMLYKSLKHLKESHLRVYSSAKTLNLTEPNLT